MAHLAQGLLVIIFAAEKEAVGKTLQHLHQTLIDNCDQQGRNSGHNEGRISDNLTQKYFRRHNYQSIKRHDNNSGYRINRTALDNDLNTHQAVLKNSVGSNKNQDQRSMRTNKAKGPDSKEWQ